MKTLLFWFTAFAFVGMVACEEPATTDKKPEQNNPEQNDPTPDPEPDPTPEPEPTPDPVPEIEPLPEATYEFLDGITARVYTLETNGLSNFYVSFAKESTSESLFIDFYAPKENSYIPTGVYPLGDGSSMTCAQEYTYLTLVVGGDLLRFTDGKATVIADPNHESGYPWYRIVALFTLPNGETVSLDYEGQLIPVQM